MQHSILIGETAKRLGLSESAVRLYDALLRPSRDTSGRRVYDAPTVDLFACALAGERAAQSAKETV